MDMLIFSDSHGYRKNMETVLSGWKRMPEFVVHLGDGSEEFEELAGQYRGGNTVFASVAGNSEEYSVPSALRPPSSRIVSFGKFRIFLCHGHRFGVKSGTEPFIPFARDNDLDVILYGHTHIPCEETVSAAEMGRDRPLKIFCPGSISLPASGSPSFGVVTEVNGVLLFSHGTLSREGRL